MIDLKDLRENPDKYRRGAELKGVKVDIDAILQADEQWRASQAEFEKLRAEQNVKGKEIAALKDPEVTKKFNDIGFEVVANSPAEFNTLLTSELARWKQVVDAGGIKQTD